MVHHDLGKSSIVIEIAISVLFCKSNVKFPFIFFTPTRYQAIPTTSREWLLLTMLSA